MRRHATLLAALLLVGLAAAQYSCDPATCTDPSCQCASTSPPGGLDPTQTPMFVLVTHDDAVSTLQNRVVRTVTDGFVNKNGCNVPATWFTIKDKTNCTIVQQLLADNHEIAGHTMNHLRLAPNVSDDEMLAQVQGVKAWLVETCMVPEEKLRGFRAPYLVHSERFRKTLQQAGYEWDSSIIEPFNTASSPSWTQRTFPYSMDAGIPQDCAWTSDPDTSCAPGEKHPGLWEVPVWLLPNLAGDNAFSMDPVAADSEELFKLLKQNFDAAYDGNRAPFPVFLHAPWFTAENSEGLLEFMKYAADKDDVWFVTVSQLIDWMKNPVPASEVGNTLRCSLVELAPPTIEYCRQYEVGEQEDIWTVGGKWGVSTDEALLAVNDGIIDGKNKWNLPAGLVVNIPPWDERCEKPGATSFASLDWYQPVYANKTWPLVEAPAPAPIPTPTAIPTPAPAVTVEVPTPAPALTVEVPAPAPAVAVEVPAPAPAIVLPGDTPTPTPVDNRLSGAASSASSAAALAMAGLAALCLML